MVHISDSTKKLLPKDKYIIRNRGVVKLKVRDLIIFFIYILHKLSVEEFNLKKSFILFL